VCACYRQGGLEAALHDAPAGLNRTLAPSSA
jgi:hypothetical protein